MVNSMTGFARQVQSGDWGELSCEIRSVNHRYLEPSLRLPESLRVLESALRDQLRERLQRGKVEINLQLTVSHGASQEVQVNTELLQSLTEALHKVAAAHPQCAAPDPVRLLQWPGVVATSTPDQQPLIDAAQTLIATSLDQLLAHRQREGQQLSGLIEERLQQIAEQVSLVRSLLPQILTAQREKLQQRLQELVVELDQQRLEQEVALLVNKSDVAEELDRLETHLGEVRHILQQSGAIGRRLDFMMQELNREANTLSSKAIATETTQAAVTIKVLIEQMREQVQNIE